MAIQRLDILVRDARIQSGDKFYSSSAGVRLSEWSRYATEAQTTIYQRILNTHAAAFNRQVELSVTQGLATVPIPSANPNAVNLGANIINVAYSFDGNAQNYYKLNLRTPSQEVSYPAYPEGYFLRDGNFVLTPIPNQPSGKIRVDFQITIPDLDVRRAKIASVTPGSALTLTVDSTLTTETEQDLSSGIVDYVCVVDRDGNILAREMPVGGYSSTTRVISTPVTVDQATAINAAIATGAYLVFGFFTTTHSQLKDTCQRYLTHSLARFAQMRDSNSEVTVTKDHLKDLEDEIIASYADLEEDITPIPILDGSYFYDL